MSYCPTFLVRLEPPFCRFVNVVYPTAQTPILQEGLPIDAFSDERSHTLWKQKDKTLSDNDVAAFYSANGSAASGSHAMEKPVLETSLASSTLQQDPETHRIRGKRQGVNKNVTSEQDSAPILRLKCDDEFCQGNSFSCCLHNSHPSTNNEFELILNTGVAGSLLNQASSGMDGSLCEGDLNGERFPTHGCLRSDTNGRLTPTVRGQKVVDLNQQDTSSKTAERLANPFSYKLRSSIDSDRPGMNKREGDYVCFALVGLDREVASETRQPEESERICDELRDAQDCCTGPGVLACVVTCAATGGSAVRVCYANHSPSSVVLPIRNLGSQVEVPQLENMQETPEPALPSKTVSQPGIAKLGSENAAAKDVSKSENVTSEIDPLESTDLDVEDTVNKSLILANKCDDVEDKLDVYTVEEDIIIRKSGDKNNNRLPAFSLQKLSSCDETVSDLETSYGGAKEQLSRYNKPLSNVIPKINERAVNNNSSFDERGEPSSDSDGEANFDDRNSADHRQPIRVNGIHDAPVNNENIRIVQEEVYIDVFHASTSGDDSCSDDDDDDDDSDADSDSRDEKYSENVGDIFKNNASSVAAVASREEPEIAVENDYLHALKPQASLDTMYAYENFLNFHNMKEVVNLKEEVVFDIGSQANGSSCVELHHAEKRKEQFKVNPLNGVASNNTQSSKSCLESLSETCEKSRDLEASDLPECSPACFATFVGRTTEEGHGYTNMEENLQDNKGVADDISRRKGFYEGKSKEENNENELDTCNEVKSEVSEKLHGHALEHPESSFPFRLMPDQKTKPTSKPRAGSRSWMGNAAFLDWDDIVESRDTREHRTISPDAIMSSRTADDLDKNCVSNTFEQEGIKYVVSDHEKNAALSNSSVDIGLKYRREEEPMETLWSESAEENPTEKLSERIFNDHESLLRLKAVRDQNVDTETSDETVPSFQNENDSRCDLSDSSDIDAFPPTASPLAANKAETQISAHAPVLEVRLSNNNPETQVEGALISIDERQGQCLLEEESLALSLEPACVIIDGHLENHCSVTAIEGEVARGSRVTTPEESTPERQYLCEDALMMKRSIVTSPDIVRGTKDVNANAADQETGVDGAIVVDTTVSKAADAVAMGSAAVSPVNEGRGQSEALDGGLERGQRLEETKDNRPLGTSTCQGKEMTHWQLAPYSETVEETSLVVLKPGSPDGISCELDLEADTVLQAGDLRQESSDTVEQALALQLERSSSTANPGETVVSSAAEVCFPHEEETECPIAEQAVKESQTLQSYVVEDLCFIDVDQNSQFADGISNTAPDTASSYLVEAAEIPDETSTAFDDLVEVKSEVHALFLGNRDGLAFSVTEDQEPDSDENECDKVVAKSYLSMTGQMKVEEESAVDEVVCTYEECSVPSDCSRSEWNSNGRESPDGTATAPLSPVSDTTTSHTEWNSNFKRFIEEHAFAENDSLHRERSVLRSVINGTVDKGSQADGDASEKHGNFDGNNETFPLTMELSEENMDLTEDSLDGISCESATPPPFDCEQDIPPERHKKPSVVLGGAKDDVIRYPMRLPTKTVLDFCCDKGCQADLILEMESKGNQTISILDFYCDKECQTKEASEVGFLQNESQVRTVQSQTELLIDQSCQVERLHEPSDSQETLDYLESDLYTDLEEVIHLLPGKIKIENANGTMPGNFVRPRQVESSLDDHVHHKECPDCPVATAQEFQVVQSDFTEPASPRINPTADVGTQKNVSHENKQCQTSPDIEQYLKRSEQRETPPLSEFQDYDSDGSQSTGKTVQNLSSPVLSPQMMDPCVTQRPRPYGQSPGPNDRFPFEFLSSRSPSFTERVASARVDKSSQALLCNCGNTCDGAKIECSFADASNPSYSGYIIGIHILSHVFFFKLLQSV